MAEWKIRTAGRVDEMSHGKMSLRIELQPDGDIVVYIEEDGVQIEDKQGNKSRVEFCDTASGGGRSPHTRRALYALFEAMKKDAKEYPDGIPKYPINLAKLMAEDKD
jgi:hypothetical protein